MIRLILSDIDGTLLDAKSRLLPPVKTAIQTFAATGGRFCLASARPPQAMTALAGDLGLTDTPLVSLNGAWIGDWNAAGTLTPMHRTPLPQEAAVQVVNAAEAQPVSVNLMCDDIWFTGAMDSWATQEAAITGVAPTVQAPKQLLETNRPVHKILLMGPPPAIDGLATALAANSALHVARSKPTYLEITANGVSKATALRFLTQHFEVPLTETMAMGDGDNDAPMLADAGIGISFVNGSAAAQAAADFIVSSSDDAGAADAILQYGLGRAPFGTP